MTLISQVNAIDWGQFGLAGAVIGGLFWLLLSQLKSHKEERAEWRQDSGSRSAKTDAVIEKLTDAIRDAKK